MNPQRIPFLVPVMAVTAMLALFVGQAGAQGSHKPPATADQATGSDRVPMQSMMAEHQKMMADMLAEQKRLDDLLSAMNAAKGTDKIDRIAAVVNEIAAAHKQMLTRMSSMHDQMMHGMSMMGARSNVSPAAPPVDHEQHHPQK